jgi:hypothetical protein
MDGIIPLSRNNGPTCLASSAGVRHNSLVDLAVTGPIKKHKNAETGQVLANRILNA